MSPFHNLFPQTSIHIKSFPTSLLMSRVAWNMSGGLPSITMAIWKMGMAPLMMLIMELLITMKPSWFYYSPLAFQHQTLFQSIMIFIILLWCFSSIVMESMIKSFISLSS